MNGIQMTVQMDINVSEWQLKGAFDRVRPLVPFQYTQVLHSLQGTLDIDVLFKVV